MLGFDRTPRAQGIEEGNILGSGGRTSACLEASVHACLEKVDAPPADSKQIINRAKRTSLCGQIVLMERMPLPWAYQKVVPGTTETVDPIDMHFYRIQCSPGSRG